MTCSIIRSKHDVVIDHQPHHLLWSKACLLMSLRLPPYSDGFRLADLQIVLAAVTGGSTPASMPIGNTPCVLWSIFQSSYELRNLCQAGVWWSLLVQLGTMERRNPFFKLRSHCSTTATAKQTTNSRMAIDLNPNNYAIRLPPFIAPFIEDSRTLLLIIEIWG